MTQTAALEARAPAVGTTGRVARAGISFTTAVAALATFVLIPDGIGYPWLPPVSALLALAGLLGAIALTPAAERTRPAALLRSVTTVWRHPPRDAYLFLLGALAALPMWALHTEVLLWDADSARIIASALYVQREGVRYLIETQENLVPHLVLGPAVALGGIAAAKFVTVLSMQFLCGTVAYLAWKASRSGLAAVAAVAAVFTFRSLPDRATLLPMYPAMLAFGFLGLYLAYRTVVPGERRRIAYAAGAGLCLFLSAESHGLGQLFLVFPLFLVFAAPLRRSLVGLAYVYGALFVAFLPRTIINVTEGGLSRFASYRIDYWITKGYLVTIQTDFWGLPVKTPLAKWAGLIPKSIPDVFGETGFLALLLLIPLVLLARGRFRWFVLGAVAFFLAIVAYRRIPFYPRYFSQLVIAAAIGAGVGIAKLSRVKGRAGTVATGVALAGLLACAAMNMTWIVDRVAEDQRAIQNGPLPRVVEAIDEPRSVIGARSGQVTFVDPYIRTYGGQFLTEDEYVTFLTWPSDAKVVDLMERHDIGWVLLNPLRRLEVAYHDTWIEPEYGLKVQHFQEIRKSPNFCHVLSADGYELYRLGACD